jgi:hypothetical protein
VELDKEIIQIVRKHRKEDGSYELYDAINELRREFPILNFIRARKVLDQARKVIDKEEEEKKLDQEEKDV